MREKTLERDTRLGLAAGNGAPPGRDAGWEVVVRKKKYRSMEERGVVDIASSVWKVPYKDTFSFFFSQFPETHGAKEMLKAFMLYGEAMEVVIPPKRDKRGRRFGFVRFRNVEDPRLFAVRLDNMIFGSRKIHVNIPRFHRDAAEVPNIQHAQPQRQREMKLDAAPTHPQQQIRVMPRVAPGINNHRRAVQVWKKKEGDLVEGRNVDKMDLGSQNQELLKPRTKEVEEPKIVGYNVPEGDMENFKKMYVGTIRTPGSTYSVQEWFSMRGFFQIKITPLGANKVLMEEMEDGVIAALLDEYKEWLGEKFVDIKSWSPDDIDTERVVWVRCHGIPVHAWHDDFFASLARVFGEYLGVDEATRKKEEMDVARIRLRSNGFDVFNAVVTATINDSVYNIKMVEEWCGPLQWIENCCKKCCKGDVESGDSSDSDDSHGGGPPLFTVEEEWCNDEEEEGDSDDDVEGPEKEDERVKEYDEVVEVQETVVTPEPIHNVGEEEVAPIAVAGVGNDNILNISFVKEGDGDRLQLSGGERELTHVSKTGGIGGVQSDTESSVKIMEENGDSGSVGNHKGIEEQRGGESRTEGGKKGGSPDMQHKKKKVAGSVKTVRNEKKKKKESDAQDSRNSTTQPLTSQRVASRSSSLLNNGVVRSSLNKYRPSCSVSLSSKASHVESIGDSGILMGNNRFDRKVERSNAEKLWRSATEKLGVSVDAKEDDFYIEKIQAMEERDKMAKEKRGKRQSSK